MPTHFLVRTAQWSNYHGWVTVEEIWYLDRFCRIVGNQMFDRYGKVGTILYAYTEDENGNLVPWR